MGKLVKKMRRGFTLVEIMIVVLIIGVLLAIAVPNFIKARESSRAKSCVANLKQIDSAKEQWAMDTNQSSGEPASGDIVGPTKYLKSAPTCPSSGNAYVINALGTNPACGSTPVPTGHVLP